MTDKQFMLDQLDKLVGSTIVAVDVEATGDDYGQGYEELNVPLTYVRTADGKRLILEVYGDRDRSSSAYTNVFEHKNAR